VSAPHTLRNQRWLLAGLAATTLSCAPLRAQEAVIVPVETLTTQLADSNVATRRDAAYQLGKIGAAAKPAVPALVRALRDQDKQVWTLALTALAELGPDAKEAMPALIESLGGGGNAGNPGMGRRGGGGRGRGGDRTQRLMRTAYALSRIGPEAISPLIAVLGVDDPDARASAARALGGMGPQAKEAIPALVTNLAYNDSTVRQESVDALALIGSESLAPVRKALASETAAQRASAALVLAQLGASAQAAEPELVALLASEKDPTVRAATLTAMAKVSADPAKAMPALVAAVGDDSEAIRHAAINAIGGTKALRRVAAAPLAAQLKSENAATRQRAAQALGRLGPDAVDVLPALLDATRAAKGEAAFAGALAQIGPAALNAVVAALKESPPAESAWIFLTLKSFGTPAVPMLMDTLRQPDASLRTAAARTLGAMGREGAAAAPALFTLAESADPSAQAAALRALTAMGSDRTRLKPLLQAAWKNPAPEMRKAGVAGLAALGESTVLGVDGLLEALGDDDLDGRLAAVQTLGQMGAKAAPAVPALTTRLDDPALQVATITALGKIGTSAAPALPRILEVSTNGSQELRAAMLTACATMGRPAAAALPQIYTALGDTSLEIRVPALNALINVEADDDKVVPVLLTTVKNESSRLRRPAVQALAKYGERARPAVPGLVAMLSNESDAGDAFATLKILGVRSVPDLLKMLDAKDNKVRVFAAESLGSMGPDAKDAASRLRELVNDQAQPVQKAVRTALAKIEPPPAPATPAPVPTTPAPASATPTPATPAPAAAT
jgi:HEAT repeat protein